MNMIRVFAVSVGFALAGWFGLAQPAAEPVDLAGVECGMPLDQAQAALAERGFMLDEEMGSGFNRKAGLSYEQMKSFIETNERVSWSEMAGTQALYLKKRDTNETVYTTFAPFKEGELAAHVSYRLESRLMTRDGFYDRLVKKYGPPNLRNESWGNLQWSVPLPAHLADFSIEDAPNIIIEYDPIGTTGEFSLMMQCNIGGQRVTTRIEEELRMTLEEDDQETTF